MPVPIGPVPFVGQVWIDPPVIIDPPMNRRTGHFQPVEENPLFALPVEPGQWVLYPARVGPLVVFVYVHQSFLGLGSALANLFEALAIWQLLPEGQKDAALPVRMTLHEADSFCCEALAFNYRVTPEIVDWLGLLDDTAMVRCFWACTEMYEILQAQESQKKSYGICFDPL